jgi:predicted RNA-binding Zn-ribbon protein involved in translation (DUF1610 family)
MAQDEELDGHELTLDEIRERASFCMATKVEEDGEVYDLNCPKCGCDKIVCKNPDLGEKARCYECGHEFTITENCWKYTHKLDLEEE